MARKKKARNPAGQGSIRQRSDGRWEGKYTVGYDPGTGKQIRKSIYGQSQSEVRQKLAKIAVEIDNGTYLEPSEATFGEWLDTWIQNYCLNVKPRTRQLYQSSIEVRIKPNLGAVKLKKLTAPMIQRFYRDLLIGNLHGKQGKTPRTSCRKCLSPKSIKNIHGIIHKALSVAVKSGAISQNPAEAVELPRTERPEIKPLPEERFTAFLRVLNGDRYEIPITVDIFTGAREGELLGLPWSAVDFQRGTVTIKQQLQRQPDGSHKLVPTKNDKPRTITPAPFVFDLLTKQLANQNQWKLKAGKYWSNPDDLVFTNELGGHLTASNVYHHFKKAATALGLPKMRFHDLRHTYAVYSLESGADIKSVQTAMGHYSAAFTLDTYAYSTGRMQEQNAEKMQTFAESLIANARK